MDTRKTVLLGIKRGAFLALLIGFALWPELTRGRPSRMPVSAQAGRSFRRATQQPRWSLDLNAVAVNAAGDVFVAAGGACGAGAASGAGVFRSSDAGASWTEQNKGLTNTSVRSLAIAPPGRCSPERTTACFARPTTQTHGRRRRCAAWTSAGS